VRKEEGAFFSFPFFFFPFFQSVLCRVFSSSFNSSKHQKSFFFFHASRLLPSLARLAHYSLPLVRLALGIRRRRPNSSPIRAIEQQQQQGSPYFAL
jgi:hypothetical protein